jgi:hypothetical protein
METFLIVVAILAVVVVAALLAHHLDRKRRRELAAMAARLGLAFSEDDTQGCAALPFALLRKGDGRGTENVMWGTWQGMPVRGFDHWYYEESTDSKGHRTKTYYRFSCAVVEIEATCSALTIDREGFFTRVADAIGLDDITFELEEFNDAFNVKSKDRRFASDFVDQRMMRFLLGADRAFRFEVAGRWLLCFSKRRRPTELIPLLETLQGFRDHVPPVVLSLYGPGASR